MVSDGSGLHARRVLKHRPVLAPVLVARPQVGPFTNVMSIPPNIGQGVTRQGYYHKPTCPAVESLLAVSAVRTYSNSTKGIQ